MEQPFSKGMSKLFAKDALRIVDKIVAFGR
jgi:hypothetical protein